MQVSMVAHNFIPVLERPRQADFCEAMVSVHNDSRPIVLFSETLLKKKEKKKEGIRDAACGLNENVPHGVTYLHV